jgi:hypothetical protein
MKNAEQLPKRSACFWRCAALTAKLVDCFAQHFGKHASPDGYSNVRLWRIAEPDG